MHMSFTDIKNTYISFCEDTFLTSSKKYFFESGQDPRALRMKTVSKEQIKQIKREKMVEGPKERWFALFLLDPINFMVENQDETNSFKLLDEIMDVEGPDFSSKRSFNQFLYLQIAVWNVFIQSLQMHLGREPTVTDIHSVAQISVDDFNEYSSRQTLQQLLMSLTYKSEGMKKITPDEVSEKIRASTPVSAVSPYTSDKEVDNIKSPGSVSVVSRDKKKALASERFNKKVLDLCMVNQENSLASDIAAIVNDIIHRIIRDFPQKTNCFVPPTVSPVESTESEKRPYEGNSNKSIKKPKRVKMSSHHSSRTSLVAAGGGLSLEDFVLDDLCLIRQQCTQQQQEQEQQQQEQEQEQQEQEQGSNDAEWAAFVHCPPSFDAFGLLDADGVDLSMLSPIAFNVENSMTLDEVLALLSPRSSSANTGMTMTAQLSPSMMTSLH